MRNSDRNEQSHRCGTRSPLALGAFARLRIVTSCAGVEPESNKMKFLELALRWFVQAAMVVTLAAAPRASMAEQMPNSVISPVLLTTPLRISAAEQVPVLRNRAGVQRIHSEYPGQEPDRDSRPLSSGAARHRRTVMRAPHLLPDTCCLALSAVGSMAARRRCSTQASLGLRSPERVTTVAKMRAAARRQSSSRSSC